MGAVEEVAVGAGNSLLNEGPIGLLALFGWLCVVIMGIVILVLWKSLRDSEKSRVQDLLDNAEAAEKDRIEMDRKMDRLQAVLEARAQK